jgi:uncharacterized membrane protein
MILLFAGVGLAHLIALEGFERFLPEWVPFRTMWVILTGILEILLAVGLLLPDTRKWAGRLIFCLLLIYAPLHVIDVMREDPVIGPKIVAILRLPLQLVLVYLAALIGWPKNVPEKDWSET